jgi:hypothetical protein
MTRHKRTSAQIAGDRESNALAASLGAALREGRRQRRERLADVSRRTAISVARLSEIERGLGGTLGLDGWVRLGLAVDRPLAVQFSRAIAAHRVADAGHLELQEWVLALARRHRWKAGLEIPTRPVDPARSVDVLLRAGETLILVECWNTIGDFGAAVRSTNRKRAEAEALSIAVHGRNVRAVWLVRPTAANRALVRAYPEAVRSRFAGSSSGWVAALTGAGAPPSGLGFVWLDPRVGVRALRIRA